MAITAATSRAISSLFLPSTIRPPATTLLLLLRPFSSASPYPLYYDLIRYRPARRPPPPHRHRQPDGPTPQQPESEPELEPGESPPAMDRSKRKYYMKRQKRMYGGSDSDDGAASRQDEFVELQPEIIDFPRLHAREEELYFHDTFAFPWEKEKHYRMVYQLEKKYFPGQCLDKAFVDPRAAEPSGAKEKKNKKKGLKEKDGGGGEERDERALMFFDDEKEKVKDRVEKEKVKDRVASDRPASVSEKRVEDFFKCLKREGGTTHGDDGGGEPYLTTRRTQLPPRWDGPSGTVVLVDKPKGWTSFTVCGKLRRLVKVQKVGHAGTLDPMATGLLIVCVGKATKLVDRYQGMVKGYSGIFRLGEATSTWDADSPVIQREPWEHIKDEDIKKSAASFCGEIWQVPPMFSAIKVGGEKMYEKARRGEMIELSPRRISIYQFDIARSLEDRQNLIFRVTCSKGTYIRSLCADLGKALGSCAHLTALRRDSIGEFSADDAWNFQELEEQITKGYF